MADVLVIAETFEGKLRKTTHSAVTFAREAAAALGGPFSILVLGDDTSPVASEAATLGAAKVLVAEDASLKSYVAERYAPTVAEVGSQFGVIVGTASAYGKALLRRVAAKLSAGYASDISELIAQGSSLRYKRPMFAGNAFGVCSIA